MLFTYRMFFFLANTKIFVHCPPVHAAVIAINEAVDRGQTSVTMGALNNPNAMLKNTQESLAQDYQDTLSQAKARKQDQCSGRVRSLTNTSCVSLSSCICLTPFGSLLAFPVKKA